jgi:hypothetical protein
MFFDPATKSIPLDASLVKGSHGVPATESKHRTALISSQPFPLLPAGRTLRDTDVKELLLQLA